MVKELYIFARFHVKPGNEAALIAAIHEALPPSCKEPGCLSIHAFRSVRDPQLFFIHSRWVNEEAFGIHAQLPHTLRFVERVEPLIDHALDVNRTEMLL